MEPKLLIIGHARHGKDTVAGMLEEHFGLKFTSSSKAAAEIFIFRALMNKYGYKTPEECFDDRVNRRAEWHDLIVEYNREDPTRLAREIMKSADIYVGMRNKVEIESCLEAGVFDFVIGVFDPRKTLEPSDSFNIDLGEHCDFIIFNDGDLERLRTSVLQMYFYLSVYHDIFN